MATATKAGEPKATRAAYGDALLALGEEHEEVVALDADLSVSTMGYQFGEKYPERWMTVGVVQDCEASARLGLCTVT